MDDNKKLSEAQKAAIKVLREELVCVNTQKELGTVIGMFWNFWNKISQEENK